MTLHHTFASQPGIHRVLLILAADGFSRSFLWYKQNRYKILVPYAKTIPRSNWLVVKYPVKGAIISGVHPKDLVTQEGRDVQLEECACIKDIHKVCTTKV